MASVPLNALLTGAYVFVAAWYLGTSDGLVDASGHLVGRDFVNHWTAGALVWTGAVGDLYDFHAYTAFQGELLGVALPQHNWPYPPFTLFLVAPFALAPYIWALGLWSLSTLFAYLVAARRLVLLFSPATFVCLLFGQTGCLIAALFICALRLLPRSPVLAGLLFGLMAIKPQFGLLVPVALVAARAWRAVLTATATITALVVGSALVFGWETWQSYLQILVPFQTAVLTEGTGLFLNMMPSAFMAGRLVGLDQVGAYLLQVPFTAVAVVTVYWAYRHRPDAPLAGAVLLLATTLATPYIFMYDLPLAAYAVLLLLTVDRPEALRGSERLSYLAVWLLPLMLIALNVARVPVGPVVLAAALAFAFARLRRTVPTPGQTGRSRDTGERAKCIAKL